MTSSSYHQPLRCRALASNVVTNTLVNPRHESPTFGKEFHLGVCLFLFREPQARNRGCMSEKVFIAGQCSYGAMLPVRGCALE